MKKDQNLPNKRIHSMHSSGKPLPHNSNYSRQQSPYITNYRGQSPNQRFYKISHKIGIVDHIVEIVKIKITNQDQIKINTDLNRDLIQILDIEFIQLIDLETIHTIVIEIYLTIEIETIQTVETLDINFIDHAIVQTTDQNIIIIKIDQ